MAKKAKKKAAKKDRPQDTWGVHQLRFTAFTATPIEVTKELWKHMARVDPTEMRLLPTVVFSGQIDLGTLVVNAAADRFDLYLRPKTSEEAASLPFAMLGQFDDALEIFSPIVNRFFSPQRPVRRLAFGAIFFQYVKDRADAIQTLLTYLPDVSLHKAEEVNELSYHVNRVKKPKTKGGPEGLVINNISKWAIAEARQATIPLDAPGRAIVSGDAVTAARLELDLSTNVEPKVISNPVAKLLVSEFYSSGRHIATRGETQ